MSARGSQAPRNNPPRHPNPLGSSPYVPEIDEKSCWYGFATEGRSFEQVLAGAEEYVKIRFANVDSDGIVLEESPSDEDTGA